MGGVAYTTVVPFQVQVIGRGVLSLVDGETLIQDRRVVSVGPYSKAKAVNHTLLHTLLHSYAHAYTRTLLCFSISTILSRQFFPVRTDVELMFSEYAFTYPHSRNRCLVETCKPHKP